MAGVNKVILVGRLGRDPEVRNFQNGGKVVNLRLATSETWKDKATGERKEKTEWHSVAIFNEAIGRVAEQYLRKGSEVYVEGSLETRKWQDQGGQDRYSTEVVIRQFNGQMALLGGGGGRDGGGRDDFGGDDHAPAGGGRSGGREDMGGGRPGGGGRPDLDDDIPF